MNLLTGNIKNLFFKYLLPSIGGALVVSLYGFVDTIAIGQGVGPTGTAAMAVTMPIFNVTGFLGVLCGIGGAILISKAKGEKKLEKGNAYFTVSLLYAAVVAVAFWILFAIFQQPIYRFFGADDAIMPYAKEYGSIIIMGFPAFIFSSYLSCIIRNDEAPNIAVAATVTGAIINIFGDWLLVFPLQMGMKGAAIATVVGTVAQVLVLVMHFFRPVSTLRLVKPHHWLPAIKQITSSGFGSSFLEIASIVTTAILNNQIMKYSGASALAVYGVVLTIATLYQQIFSGVGQAAQPIISTNFGANKPDRIKQVHGLAIKTVIIIGIVVTAISLLFPQQIISLFLKTTPEVMAVAPQIIRVYSLSFIMLGINTYAIFYLQSIIQSKMAAMIALLRGVGVNGILLFILPLFMKAAGIWWAIVLSETIVMMIAIIYMRKLNHKSYKPTIEGE